MNTIIEEVKSAVHQYNCIGSWWSYEDKIPPDVKEYLASKYKTTVVEIDRIAQEYVAPMYHDNKPDIYNPSYIGDWG